MYTIMMEDLMTPEMTRKMIAICNEKIAKKGENVGLSFYAFFANKNDDPETLMQVATSWIQTHKLDHFEKAIKIKQMIENEFRTIQKSITQIENSSLQFEMVIVELTKKIAWN